MSKARRKSTPPEPVGRQARTPDAQRNWQLDVAIGAGLVLAIWIVYSQVGHYFFITFDDPLYISENFHVRAGLTPANIKWAFSTFVDANWVPLTMLSHMAVCDLFDLQSGMHHWVNVVLHAVASLILFEWLKHATRDIWPSAFVAFVFALHPLHVESVAWLSERKDVLSTLFWFLALYAYVRYAERPDVRRYLAVIALFCLGLMSKPMLVTFPFTLLLLDIWPLRRVKLPTTIWEKLPFFALSAASAVVTYFAQQSGGAVQALPLGQRVTNALISYAAYLRQMFWPTGLAFFYPLRTTAGTGLAIASLVMIVGVSIGAVRAWRSHPYIATGWFWYLGTLVPVIGLVQVGVQSHADRYMYVPMVGLSIVLAWGAADVLRKWPQAKAAILSVAIALCLGCLVVASAQAEYWRDSGTLYRRAISVTENNYVAEYNLGDYLVAIPGHEQESVTHFEEALRIRPDSPSAHNGLGGYLLQTGHDEAAAAQFEAALRTEPNLAAAHFNLGLIYAKNPGRLQEAISHYEAALRTKPNFARAHKNLGILFLRLNRTSEAMQQFAAAQSIQYDPEIAQIMSALQARHR